MKAILTFSMLLITAFLYGQVPQRMSYHALIKNDVSGIITNQKITLRTAIRQGSPNGETVYMELHETQTSSSGIASVSIGNGDVIQGQFENIDWSKGNYFITSEADIDGDNIFSEVTLRELLSVPYAFYAEKTNQPGPPGKSAYEIWLDQGNKGSIDDFLNSLIGPPGDWGSGLEKGGVAPPGFCDNVESCVLALDLEGPPGPTGADGLSAYEVWLNNGNIGTETDFLASLVGPQGPIGPAGADGADGAVGPQGPIGPAGADGADGAVGPQGPVGPAGADGADGAIGPQGPAGADGLLPNGTDPGNLPHWTGSNWSVSSTALDYDGSNLALNDNQIRLRGAGDGNHVLGFLGGAFDGPLLQGFSSVVLKTVSGGDAGGLFLKNSRVGIGTNNPTNGRLHVESSFGVGFSYGYLNGGGSIGYCGGCGGDVSIWAQRRVAAEEFNAFSDARIKEVIGVSNSESDLAKIMQLKITDYTFVDTIAKGSAVQKKVIAQEVEQIYPEAVKQIRGVVPNIFQLTNIKEGKILVSNELKSGDKVKLIYGEKAEIFEVETATSEMFTVELDYEGKVFVFGQEVDDFRTVDYEAISMLNVSATQALYKKVIELENANDQLKEMNSSLKTLKAQVEEMQSAIGVMEQMKKDINTLKSFNSSTVNE